VPTGCTDLPQLAASSSSEKSNDQRGNEETPSSAEEKLSSFADKISSTCHVDRENSACQMDTICAKIEFEKEKGPSKPALTEQGELLRIEGPPPPKSWTEELSSKVQDAQRAISSKTHCLFIALGLSTKKEQTLMTDFYTTQSAKQLKPKKESENKAPASSVPFSAQYLVTAIGLGSKVESKEKKQTLMTEFDPNKAPPAVLVAEKTSSTVTETKAKPEKSEIPDVPTVPSETTIATEVRDEEKQTKWNLWKQVKSFMSKFKLAEINTPTFGAVPSLPSFGVFLCNPKVADEESTAKVAKTDDGQVMVEVAKVEVIKVEKTKVEETKVEETKVEEAKVKETKVKETKVEETKVEEAKVEMANAEKAKTEENKND